MKTLITTILIFFALVIAKQSEASSYEANTSMASCKKYKSYSKYEKCSIKCTFKESYNTCKSKCKKRYKKILKYKKKYHKCYPLNRENIILSLRNKYHLNPYEELINTK